MDKAYCAIENDSLDSPQFEEVWCDVYETAVKRCEKVCTLAKFRIVISVRIFRL